VLPLLVIEKLIYLSSLWILKSSIVFCKKYALFALSVRKIVNSFIRVVPNSRLKEKEFLNLLVYIIHPESAICLGNHILKFSRFSCHKGNTWVANITLRTWHVKVLVKRRPLADFQTHTFRDDEPIQLPSLEKLWLDDKRKRGEKPRLEKLCFELDVSSIVLSTNEFGDFSKCTVVSALMENHEMELVVREAQKLWQKFVRQPRTGRCLVFFLVLSQICERMAKQYETAIAELTLILDLNVGTDLVEFLTEGV
jgi:hypothetical protein